VLLSTAAAFCNAAAVSALDFDDGHRGARGHPGAAIIPTVLSVASGMEIGADEVFAATALGYETGIRIARAQNTQAIKSRQSGRWTGYGVVSAAGRLHRSNPEKIAHALAVVGVLSPNQEANGSSGYARLTGNDVKEGIPWSVVTGLTAFHLTEQGFTGPQDILDHASHFDRETIINGLLDPIEISRVYFKPYSCCRYIHPALDAFAELAKRFDLRCENVVSVNVETFQWALRLSNSVVPQTLTDVQYSLPYCIAIAAVDGLAALSPINPGQLGRSDLSQFASRVRLSIDREIDARFPAETLARLSIETGNGAVVHSDVTIPRGDPSRPMDWDDLCEKFLKASRLRMPSNAQRMVMASIEALKSGDSASFSNACACR
jgi:2-methylcitrate dehydratase PrpD